MRLLTRRRLDPIYQAVFISFVKPGRYYSMRVMPSIKQFIEYMTKERTTLKPENNMNGLLSFTPKTGRPNV